MVIFSIIHVPCIKSDPSPNWEGKQRMAL
jgi:hypothetical protein